MKAIEDLGVSPLPWGAEQNGVPYVVDANGYNVATIDGDSLEQAYSNTHLLKTAPKLYEAGNAAYDALEGLCPWYGKCLKCLHGCFAEKDGEFWDSKKEYCTKSDRADCMVFIALSKLRASIEEACGEVNADAGVDNLAARVRDCLDEVSPSEEAQRLLNEDGLK